MESQYYKKLDEHIKSGGYVNIDTYSSVVPLTIDQVLRSIVLFLFKNSLITDQWFLLIQVLIIPIILSVAIGVLNKRIKKSFQGKIEVSKLIFYAFPGRGVGIIISFLVILSWFILTNVLSDLGFESNFLRIICQFVLFIVFTFYLFVISVLSNSRKVSEISFFSKDKAKGKVLIDLGSFDAYNGSSISKMKKNEEKFSAGNVVPETDNEDIDTNDIEIVKIEADMKNMINRSESYIIESVFIGALTFSGFLAIVSSDKIQENIYTLRSTVSEINALIRAFFDFKFDSLVIQLDLFITSWSLFGLIAIECLACSTFFILVLATRTKFSSLIEQLNYLLEVCRIFNNKEEEINLLKHQDIEGLESRGEYLKEKIEDGITGAKKIIVKIKPIFNYMVVFRNIGLYTFYLILVTSGLYFSYSVSLTIMGIVMIGYLLRTMFTLFNKIQIKRITGKVI